MNMPGLSRISAQMRRLPPRTRPVKFISALSQGRRSCDAYPQLLAVTPERFADQMAHLSHHFEVVSLHELVSRMPNGGTGSRPCSPWRPIEGYADNLSHAKKAHSRIRARSRLSCSSQPQA